MSSGSALPTLGKVFLGPNRKGFQALVLVPFTRWFADAEVKLCMDGTDLQTDHFNLKSGAESGGFGLKDVVDVIVLVSRHEDINGTR